MNKEKKLNEVTRDGGKGSTERGEFKCDIVDNIVLYKHNVLPSSTTIKEKEEKECHNISTKKR
jgi:hypothetical protein